MEKKVKLDAGVKLERLVGKTHIRIVQGDVSAEKVDAIGSFVRRYPRI